MARPKEHNWPDLFDSFNKAEKKDNTLTLERWCGEQKLAYTNTSKHFSELRKLRIEKYLAKTREILTEAAPQTATNLVRISNLQDDGKETIAAKAAIAVLDRVGLSPQVAQVQVIQSNQQNLIAPVLFAAQHLNDAGDMLKPIVEVDDDE